MSIIKTERLTMNYLYLTLALIFFLGVFLFTLIDSSLFSLPKRRVETLKKEKRRGSSIAIKIYKHLDYHKAAIATLKIGCLVGFVSFLTVFWTKEVTKNLSLLISYFMALAMLILFTEGLGRTLGTKLPDKIILALGFVCFLFDYLIAPLSFVTFGIIKMIRENNHLPKTVKFTEDELKDEIMQMEQAGTFDPEDRRLLLNSIELNYRSVYEVMTPRVDTVMIEEDARPDDIKKIFFESKYSRIPVYSKDEDNIIGLLRERDFLTSYIENSGKVDVKGLLQEPLYCFETTKLYDLIQTMQKQKQHFAVVSDEYGGTSGIVTLEDLLESLVGEIYDEDDEVVDTLAIKEEDGKYIVSGELNLDTLSEKLKLDKLPETRSNTVGGLFFELSSVFPKVGRTVEFKTIRNKEEILVLMQVKKMQKKRIISLSLEFTENKE